MSTLSHLERWTPKLAQLLYAPEVGQQFESWLLGGSGEYFITMDKRRELWSHLYAEYTPFEKKKGEPI